MRALRRFMARLTGVVNGSRQEARFQEELAGHIALQTEENVRAGMSPAEARRQAVVKFGAVQAIVDDYRDQRSLPFLETLRQDLGYAIRTLRRDKGFTAIVIAILAIGIGANTAIFSILNAVLLRPLPFYAADRLVWIENEYPNHKTGGLSGITSQVPVYWEWQQRNRSFEQLEGYNAFFNRGSYTMSGAGEPERLTGVEVTHNFFPMLGVQPQIGRMFHEAESQRNGPRAAILSHGLWQRRFGGNPEVVGRTVVLNDVQRTIVGVMPSEFDFGTIFTPGVRVDLYVPAELVSMKNWGNTLAVVGRLKPGVSLEQARAEFRILMPQVLENRREWKDWTGAYLQPLHEAISGGMRGSVLLLAAAVGVVLLIVSVNIGNLLLARAAARRQELAIRMALGAGRGRLIRQMLTESLLLAGTGAAAGIVLAIGLTRGLTSLEEISLPLLQTTTVDATALAFTVAAAVITGLLFGLMPALEASRSQVQEDLKESGRGNTEGRRGTWIRSVLVSSEIALACLLVAGAGLLIRSFLHVLDVDLGFTPTGTIALRVDPTANYKTPEQRVALLQELLGRVQQIPGIQMASITDALPLDRNRSWGLRAKGRSYPKGFPAAYIRIVMPGYFQTMSIPLLAGRDFNEHDKRGNAKVVMINETAARMVFPNENPIGQTAVTGGRELQVIGVVRDVKHSGPEQAAGLEFYLPILQEMSEGTESVDLVMRTNLNAQALSASVRGALRPVDPNLPLTQFRQLQTLVDRAVSPRRVIVWLLGAFALIAVTLACIGVYGVVSYSVRRRTQEIGVRMALGASPADVRRYVLRETLTLTVAGVVIGVGAGLAVSRLGSSLLYGVTPHDPLTFLVAPVVLTVVAVIAGYLPARRASRIDPMMALRTS